MRILISNDDGIYAPGLNALARRLCRDHEVTVVAPSREQSASGHSITIGRILRAEEITLPGVSGVACKVDGTPADCILFGILEVMSQRPDIVISGINDGQNLGTDALYSGTVSAAMEGAVNGIRSMAVSLCRSPGIAKDFDAAARCAQRLMEKYSSVIVEGTMLNINIPPTVRDDTPEVFTRVGKSDYNNHFIRRSDPFGRDYYWLAGEPTAEKINGDDTDIEYFKRGYVTIVPLNYDLTDSRVLEDIRKGWELD